MKCKKIKTAVGSLTVKTRPVPIYEYLFILTDSTVETDKILLAGEKKSNTWEVSEWFAALQDSGKYT